MEFNEKLQELRRQKGLTQEELAKALFVSRTAISKWESGRGYPSIDSLKLIAKFFGLTIDKLLSSDELLNIAREDKKQYDKQHFTLIVFALSDIFSLMMFFLPLFAQNLDGIIQTVSLLSLTEISLYLRILFFIIVIATVIFGVFSLVLQNRRRHITVIKRQIKISLILHIIGVLLFILSKQTYAAVYCFILLAIKAFFVIKKQ